MKEITPKLDCFVLSSKIETFGVVLIEVMSCGLSVLSQSGGPESIITNDDTWYIVSNEELETLKDITKKKFDSKLLRKYVIDHFSEDFINSTS